MKNVTWVRARSWSLKESHPGGTREHPIYTPYPINRIYIKYYKMTWNCTYHKKQTSTWVMCLYLLHWMLTYAMCIYNLPQIARAHKFHTILYVNYKYGTPTCNVSNISIISNFPIIQGIFLSITTNVGNPNKTVVFLFTVVKPTCNQWFQSRANPMLGADLALVMVVVEWHGPHINGHKINGFHWDCFTPFVRDSYITPFITGDFGPLGPTLRE